MKNILVLYHDGCNDGFGAAWAAWQFFGDMADYVPLTFGDAPPPLDLVRNKSVYLLDISYPPEEIMALARAANQFVLLDHHETAFQQWKGDQPAIINFNADLPNGSVQFDLERSGAIMAWEHFHREPAPGMLRFIQEYDLGRTFRGTALPGTEEYIARLGIEPKSFERWDFLSREHRMGESGNYRSDELEKFLYEGGLMVRQQKALAEKICNSDYVMPMVINGVQGLMVNGGQELTNEIGHILAIHSGTFGAMWAIEGDRVRISLRADGHCDVGSLAKALGGGGRKNTAGALIPLQRFIPEILTPAMILNRSLAAAEA